MAEINLIAIAGNAGAGKDTVGKIIQYLFYQQAGYIYDFEQFLEESDRYREIRSKWEVKKFAFKLKQIASLLTGVPIEKWEAREFKKTTMPEEWNYLKQMFECDENNQDGYSIMPMTYREFLQKLGTEAIRDGLHANTWVNALFADYKYPITVTVFGETEPVGVLPISRWIITDLRFPNEFEAVKQRGGLCIRVERTLLSRMEEPNADRVLDKETLLNAIAEFQRPAKPEHSSETALLGHQFDYVLSNHASIDELVEEVRKMLIHFKLITCN